MDEGSRLSKEPGRAERGGLFQSSLKIVYEDGMFLPRTLEGLIVKKSDNSLALHKYWEASGRGSDRVDHA
jgi:hypothetical protein